jgi:hypothetical protein
MNITRPTTEDLPVLEPAQEPFIVTGHRDHGGWIAALASNPDIWEWGPSEAEAVFFLLLLHPDIFGVIRREGQAR